MNAWLRTTGFVGIENVCQACSIHAYRRQQPHCREQGSNVSKKEL